MKPLAGTIRLSATDLSNHLACRHVTTLDLGVARGEKRAPDWAAPHLVVIRELGKQHEAAYLDYLVQRKKMAVVNLGEIKDETLLVGETLRLMEQGSEVIAQGAMASGKWFGRPDVLRRVAKRSPKWEWSYEVADTKLTSDTKAATLLQLSLYSELLEQAQGCGPESMWVIPPGKDFEGEPYRVMDYAAYFRYVKSRLERVAQNGDADGTYPEPVPHQIVSRREVNYRREVNPQIHVYHFGAYEPGALKRLMGMHATREDEVDRLLRAHVLVDLHQAYRQGIRASVEEYSLKKAEPFYGFERKTPLDESRVAMRYVEHRLELGRQEEELPDSVREVMEGYNREDCLSAAALRDWLEEQRRKAVESGKSVSRPPETSGGNPPRACRKDWIEQRRRASGAHQIALG